MSVACMTWVFTHSTAAGSDRLLLLAIADHAGDTGGDAWPSVPTLARKTGISERSVQRGIQRLEAGGHLRVERGAGRGGTNRYEVVMATPTGDRLTPPVVTEPTNDPRQSVTGDSPAPVTELRHRGGDTQVSPERPRTSFSPQPPDTSGGDTSAPTTAAGRKRPSRADGTSPRQLAAAARAAAAAQLHHGQVDERRAKQQAIAACSRCSKAGYLPGGKVCDHTPDGPDRAARGLELVRAELEAVKARKRTAS